MAEVFCSICLEPLTVTNPGFPHVGTCGHVFHSRCISQWISPHLVDDYEVPINSNYCPECNSTPWNGMRIFMQSRNNQDLVELTSQFDALMVQQEVLKSQNSDSEKEIDRLRSLLARKDDEIENLKGELKILKPQIGSLVGGSRLVIHMDLSSTEIADSNCVNCESKDHGQFACPNPPIIRSLEWSPSHDRVTNFVIVDMSGYPQRLRTAGEQLTLVSQDLGVRRYYNGQNFRREEVQAIWSFLFHRQMCFDCGYGGHTSHGRGTRSCPSDVSRRAALRLINIAMRVYVYGETESQKKERVKRESTYGLPKH